MMKKRRLERINDAKQWLKEYKDMPYYDIKTIYRKKYNLNNEAAHKDLACLGFEEAIIKTRNIKKSREERKLKKKKPKFNSIGHTDNSDDDLPF